jgi:hypothetical protein
MEREDYLLLHVMKKAKTTVQRRFKTEKKPWWWPMRSTKAGCVCCFLGCIFYVLLPHLLRYVIMLYLHAGVLNCRGISAVGGLGGVAQFCLINFNLFKKQLERFVFADEVPKHTEWVDQAYLFGQMNFWSTLEDCELFLENTK